MRKALDTFYAATAALAALATVLIGVVVLVQVGGRLLGFGVRGADDLVAWLTACACIAGAGYAFSQGSHVKVDLLTERLTGKVKSVTGIAATSVALVISGFAAYACMRMVVESFALGEVSQGEIPVKLWIPQAGVAIGAFALAVAVADEWVRRLVGTDAPEPASAGVGAGEI
jgi:TRAP-type C4-dicarboxylate transport system permease small subunit